MSIMQAAVTTAQSTLVIQNIPAPDLPMDGALIRVIACGVCGSDLDKLHHRHVPSGTVLGHEVVGVIDQLSDQARARFPQLMEGQRVAVAHHVPCQDCHYCRHGSPSMCRQFKQTNLHSGGFGQWVGVSAHHLAQTVFPLPSFVDDLEASCMEPLACCLRAIDRIPPGVGSDVLMVGMGFIGTLTAYAMTRNGYRLYGTDIRSDRLAYALEQSLIQCGAVEPEKLTHLVNDATHGRGVDVVFLTVVTPETIDLALHHVRDGGVILLFCSRGSHRVKIDPDILYFRELTIMTSYSPSLHHLQTAYDWIIQGSVKPVVSHLVQSWPLNRIREAIEHYQAGTVIKVLITL
jgi:L-iditol 2-dehydrogenase